MEGKHNNTVQGVKSTCIKKKKLLIKERVKLDCIHLISGETTIHNSKRLHFDGAGGGGREGRAYN